MEKKGNHSEHEHEEIQNGIALKWSVWGCVSKLCENGSSTLLPSLPLDLLGAMVRKRSKCFGSMISTILYGVGLEMARKKLFASIIVASIMKPQPTQ